MQPDERSRYLDTWCAFDPAMRAELDELLRCYDAAGGFLETPPVTSVPFGELGPPDSVGEEIPERLGKFAIERVLGVGGMGRVYLARSEQPRRRVALKVVRTGLASASMRRRFEQEAQVVALLQHPGIAQLYEAGTASMGDAGGGSAVPYFAMEFIDGPTLSEHARAAGLNARQRLELIAKVCDAAEHAHQRSVVHRDLKPGNILVDASGQPKILDFGVARLTDPETGGIEATLHTQAGQLIGTLSYMSPEQVAGDPLGVDARSDVYSLGAILYELLGGELPIDVRSRSFPEALRAVREDTPAPLGSLDRTLRGDVETIVAKALEKEPARRYQSAGDLAADLRRYLRDEPIVARPPGTWYQLSKFTRRNTALVGGTAAAILALSAGLVAALWQASIADRARVEADKARAEAERSLDDARETNQLLERLFTSADPDARMGKDVTVMQVLDGAASRLESSLARQPHLRGVMHRTIAGTYRGIDDYAKAEVHARAAARIHEELHGPRDRDTILSQNTLAGVLEEQGRVAEAIEIERRQWEAALAALPQSDPLRMTTQSNLAGMLLHAGEWEEAGRLYREVLEVRERTLPPDASEIQSVRMNLGRLLTRTGRLRDAEAIQRSAVDAYRTSGRPLDSASFGVVLALANTLLETNKFEEADALADELLRDGAALFAPDQNAMLSARNVRAQVLLHAGQPREAEEEYRAIITAHERSQIPAPDGQVRIRSNLGEALRLQGRMAEAEAEFRAALQILDDRKEPPDRTRVGLLNNLATVLRLTKRYQEAGELYVQMIDISRKVLPPDDWYAGLGLYGHGVVMLASRKPEEAEARFTEAYNLLLKTFDESDPAVVTVMRSFVNLYDLWQKPDKAALWRAKLPEQFRGD
jgi:non-specific serine/threonine protein kinase/serine/threonine-protein kinase